MAALGISMTAHAFAFERDELERVLTDVAEHASEVLSNAANSSYFGRNRRS